MSPDIVLKYLDGSGKKYNTEVDLWSLGVITYELLTGSPPFLGKNIDEVFNSIKKGVYSLPKNLKVSVEIISFINGLLQYYPEKRLNWEQINSHHFLTKNVNEFTYIDLEMVNENEKDKIQINTKDSDNLLWVLLKNNNINVNLDKINQEEIKKPEVKKVIDKTKVKNEEVEKALEKDRIEIQNEKQKIQEMKQKAEEEKKKAQLEKLNCEKEKEKIIQEENSVKTKKDELEKLIKEGTKKKDIEENTKKVEELELQ
jgi:serine/threonine protein kinase